MLISSFKIVLLENNANETISNNTRTIDNGNSNGYTWGLWSLVIVMIGIILCFIGFCVALGLFMKCENPDVGLVHHRPVKLMTGNVESQKDEDVGQEVEKKRKSSCKEMKVITMVNN